MRLDMDLVRRIVLDAADAPGSLDSTVFTDDENSRQKVSYHVEMLRDAGYIKATIVAANGDAYYISRVDSLTYAGQELAASLRSSDVWRGVKDRLKAVGGSVGLSVLSSVAEATVKARLGL